MLFKNSLISVSLSKFRNVTLSVSFEDSSSGVGNFWMEM